MVREPKEQDFSSTEYATTWKPAISEACFGKIRSLRVEIALRHYRHNFMIKTSDVELRRYYKSTEQVLYTACDCLHMLIRQLETVRPHINSLEIFIEVHNMYKARDEILAAAQVLLRPFRRLQKVSNPCVRSVICSYENPALMVDIVFPDPTGLKTQADLVFQNYLRRWEKELSGCEPSPELAAISEAYWEFEKLLHNIQSQQGSHCVERPNSFDSILRAAKAAREAGDLAGFRDAWSRLAKIWSDYTDRQEKARQNVSRELHSVYNMISVENGMRLGRFVRFAGDTVNAHDDDHYVPDLDKLDDADVLSRTDDAGMMYTKTSEGTALRLLTPKAVSLEFK